MEYKEIKKYISDMEISKLDELKIEFPDGTKIEMKKNLNNNVNYLEDNMLIQQFNKQAVQASIQPIQPIQPIQSSQQINTVLVNTEENKINEKAEENCKIIKSPMVGTFYSKPSPDSEPFVKVGDKVKKGQTICIVEAMKLMNEIESEYDGEVIEICYEDENMVEYGSVLIKIK